jgi:hypothetical protein
MINSYCGFRQVIYQRNLTSDDITLFYIDKFIINNLCPGSSICLDDIPNYYKNIIDDLNMSHEKYDNIIIINNSNFAYKTSIEINTLLTDYKNLLTEHGRILISLNLHNIIYDRVNVTVDSIVDQSVTNFKLLNKFINFKLPTGYGHCFLVLEK